jgi:hypothetical protein
MNMLLQAYGIFLEFGTLIQQEVKGSGARNE